MKKNYGLIDIGKLFFACAIPLLHINIGTGKIQFILQQYIARLGVPFFFAVSGFFLSKSIANRGNVVACKKFVKRLALLLGFWLIIYSPLIFISLINEPHPIQILLFKTPAYLWYITALIVGSLPFLFIRSNKILYTVAILLYLAGTLLGGSYSWLTGGWPLYESIFITTRNGVFFAFPMLCVGKLISNSRKKNINNIIIGLVLSAIILVLEITFVKNKILLQADSSMYICAPLFIFYLVLLLKTVNTQKHTAFIRECSTAIYIMQFGIISVFNYVMKIFKANNVITALVTYVMVDIIPCTVCKLLKNTKVLKYIL